MLSALRINFDRFRLGNVRWKEQFVNAFKVNGDDVADDDDDEPSPPSPIDYVMHVITFPWKVMFAFVPPTEYCGGWLCFCVSLFLIGVLTAAINDLATTMGCLMNMSKMMTAITFVALGTSLPDTFASMTAAKIDPTADACIGNITGSNAVNVFLGLGVPWFMASVYWEVVGPSEEWLVGFYPDAEILAWRIKLPKGGFVVEAKSLGFSVAVFCICAIICFMIMIARRRAFGGELGGPTVAKHVTVVTYVSLWFIYIFMSWWYEQTYE